jgi:hypothetical protein
VVGGKLQWNMVSRRRFAKPVPKLPIWRKADDLFFCERGALERVVAALGAPEALLRSRMGHGYHHLDDALAGKGLDCWAASFLESGLSPMTDQERHDFHLGHLVQHHEAENDAHTKHSQDNQNE